MSSLFSVLVSSGGTGSCDAVPNFWGVAVMAYLLVLQVFMIISF